MIARSVVKVILPLACSWARKQEALILRTGRALSATAIADAKEIGLAHPGRVRLCVVDEVPLPAHPLWRQLAQKLRLIPAGTNAGMTLRYGIFIRSDHASNRALIVHELAHTAQYERLGGFRPFLKKYLYECLTDGYPLGSLEMEAADTARRLCGTLLPRDRVAG